MNLYLVLVRLAGGFSRVLKVWADGPRQAQARAIRRAYRVTGRKAYPDGLVRLID